MRVYAQFLVINTERKLSEAVGSDGAFILGGRNSIQTQKNDAMVKMHRLRAVRPEFVGYRIYRGARFSNNNLLEYEWVRSGTYEGCQVKALTLNEEALL